MLLERWRDDYSRVRPHSALAYRTPEEAARMWSDSREPGESKATNEHGLEFEIAGA